KLPSPQPRMRRRQGPRRRPRANSTPSLPDVGGGRYWPVRQFLEVVARLRSLLVLCHRQILGLAAVASATAANSPIPPLPQVSVRGAVTPSMSDSSAESAVLQSWPREFVVGPEGEGKRLDAFLVTQLENVYSRAAVQRAISAG